MKTSLEQLVSECTRRTNENGGFFVIANNKGRKAKIIGGGNDLCLKEHPEEFNRIVVESKSHYDNVIVIL